MNAELLSPPDPDMDIPCRAKARRRARMTAAEGNASGSADTAAATASSAPKYAGRRSGMSRRCHLCTPCIVSHASITALVSVSSPMARMAPKGTQRADSAWPKTQRPALASCSQDGAEDRFRTPVRRNSPSVTNRWGRRLRQTRATASATPAAMRNRRTASTDPDIGELKRFPRHRSSSDTRRAAHTGITGSRTRAATAGTRASWRPSTSSETARWSGCLMAESTPRMSLSQAATASWTACVSSSAPSARTATPSPASRVTFTGMAEAQATLRSGSIPAASGAIRSASGDVGAKVMASGSAAGPSRLGTHELTPWALTAAMAVGPSSSRVATPRTTAQHDAACSRRNGTAAVLSSGRSSAMNQPTPPPPKSRSTSGSAPRSRAAASLAAAAAAPAASSSSSPSPRSEEGPPAKVATTEEAVVPAPPRSSPRSTSRSSSSSSSWPLPMPRLAPRPTASSSSSSRSASPAIPPPPPPPPPALPDPPMPSPLPREAAVPPPKSGRYRTPLATASARARLRSRRSASTW
mmetsp:Transcript_18670/g.70936  ORF Transcript_18670/g.70936 Transcript_18670/m.70936 type:complete len:525 (-) Transcript_18670:937-2511(-)